MPFTNHLIAFSTVFAAVKGADASLFTFVLALRHHAPPLARQLFIGKQWAAFFATFGLPIEDDTCFMNISTKN